MLNANLLGGSSERCRPTPDAKVNLTSKLLLAKAVVKEENPI